MKMTKNRHLSIPLIFITIFGLLMFTACAPRVNVTETEYSSEGRVAYKSVTENDKVIRELRRVFEGTRIEGIGIIENANEGLARRTAIQLAVAELASQVQTRVRAETVIYNNQDIRDVVENRVKALVNNYQIDFAGYDPGSIKYRARVSISGENLVKEIEKRYQY